MKIKYDIGLSFSCMQRMNFFIKILDTIKYDITIKTTDV